jgi:hypothetical protein
MQNWRWKWQYGKNLQWVFQKLYVEVELEGFIYVDSDGSVDWYCYSRHRESGDNMKLEDKEPNDSGDNENISNVM